MNPLDPLDPLDSLREMLSRYHVPDSRHGNDLPGRVAQARQALARADHGGLLRELPGLISDAQRHRAAYFDQSSPQADRAACLLSQVYRTTADLLRQTGPPDLAWLASDRALATGHACGCPDHHRPAPR